MPDLTWRSLADDPQGTSDLLDDAEGSARAVGSQAAMASLLRLRRRLQDGNVQGAVFRDPEGELWAAICWERIGDLGRRVSPILLATDRRSQAGWTGFLSFLLERFDPSARVLILQTPTPGVSSEEVSALLVPFGFRAFRRFRMQFPAGTPVPSESSRTPPGGRIRNLRQADRDELARLSSACYATSIDRFLFSTETAPLAQAQERITALLNGRVGTFYADASFGFEADGHLLGATMVTREGAHYLLADVEVHPSVRRQGLARRLIRTSLDAISRGPSTPTVLAVTEQNRRAVGLYRSLGFVMDGEPQTFWADVAALGLPDPEAIPNLTQDR